ncbi:hypothetical protein [Collimonas sp.]|jgi:hypothetical protein|uniref:hypothetical protein n=1 Tax=Collimonas sp. TaxID=1963772 RepID=UPI0037C15498
MSTVAIDEYVLNLFVIREAIDDIDDIDVDDGSEQLPDGTSESLNDDVPAGDLSDDPDSPSYRFRDKGYIIDSPKEKARDVIHNARGTGEACTGGTLAQASPVPSRAFPLAAR